MNRAIRTSLCFAVFGLTAASCSFAQDPAPRARTAANRAIVIRKAGSSYLGIGVAEIDSERAKALNLKEVHGVEVKSVDHDSPAAKAGLKNPTWCWSITASASKAPISSSAWCARRPSIAR